MGITKFAKMKGIEKFGCVFYLVLFLNTDLANTYYFEGDKKIKEKETTQMLKKWLCLFETCLYYHDWIMKRSFRRNTLKDKNKSIRTLHALLKELVLRKELGIKYVPKFHEFFHVTRNILWHGPCISYDTRPQESSLRLHKGLSQNTQRQLSSFCYQTAKRLYENMVVILTLGFVKKLGSRMLENYKISSLNQNGESSDNEQLHLTQRNRYYMKYNARTKIVVFCTDKEFSNEIQNSVHFNSKLNTF